MTSCIASIAALILTGFLINDSSIALADDAACRAGDFYYETVSMDVEGETAGKTCYTASELKTVSDDLSKNGTSSKYYAKFHASMLDEPEDTTNPYDTMGTDGFMKMGNKRSDLTGVNNTGSNTDGDIMEFRLIGINHDDRADGSGKAGLTFQAIKISNYPYDSVLWDSNMKMNKYDSNNGGWKDSNYRQVMNNGIVWDSLPESFRKSVTP